MDSDIEKLKLSSALDRATESLEHLEAYLRADEEYRSRKVLDEAASSLGALENVLKNPAFSQQEIAGKERKLLDLAKKLEENTALSTALGAMQAEFAGLLERIEKTILARDLNRIRPTEHDPKGQGR